MGNNGGNCCITQLVDNGSAQSHRFYLARKTLFQMLSDRGYDVPTPELIRSLTEFRSEFGNDPNPQSLFISLTLRANPSSKILVIFGGAEEIRKANMCSILNQITNRESLHRIIFVLQSKMNHHARKLVDEFPIKIEVFQITDLLVNVTKHALFPKQEVLMAKEKEALLEKYELKDHQMPQMLEKDAIARYYGFVKGQVVRVSYNAELAGSLVAYRCVMG